MDIRFGTQNVRSLYNESWLKTVVKELAKYKLDSAEVQEWRWDKSGTEPGCNYIYFSTVKD
jgi:hypothetical protein